MRAFLVFLLIVFIGVSGAAFYLFSNPANVAILAQNVERLSSGTLSAIPLLEKLFDKKISTPGPLRGAIDGPAGTLTTTGIFYQTNQHRKTEGLHALQQNEVLDRAAQSKLDDMFDRQYFEHVAPDGTGPADLVEQVGYRYLSVGENLALGNYQDDAAIVQAWMNSPGHRENILNPGFTEIGLAVGQSVFEDHDTWLAVQTFALPSAACPEPDGALQVNFDNKQSKAEILNDEIEQVRPGLDQQINELAALAKQANTLVQQGNQKIDDGNKEIEQGNTISQTTGEQSAAQQHWDKGKQLQKDGQLQLDQAADKQKQFDAKRNSFQQQQEDFNEKVDQLNQLEEELASMAEQLNEQIRGYNTCLKSYSSES